MSIDILITGGRIVDGTGNPWCYADVAIQADRIADIIPPGQIPPSQVREVVDARNMVVCPGFIDIQSHSILTLMRDGRSLSKITQGVTTEIMGEAWTPAPFGGQIDDPFANALFVQDVAQWAEQARSWRRFQDWLAALTAHGVSPNIGSFLGGGTLRQYACGMRMGRATPDELRTMRRVMAEAMDDGAFGVSYALIYPPDSFADTDEIVAMCEIVAEHRGIYITHLRSEAEQLVEAIGEAIAIGRRAKLPVEIYHLKAAGRPNWHLVPAAVAAIEQARSGGVDVTADMYPYAASGTGLSAILPPWADADGRLYQNLADPIMRAKIRAEVLEPNGEWEAMAHNTTPQGVMPIGFRLPEHQAYVGKRLAEIAELRGQHWVDTALDLLGAEGQRIRTIYFSMDEANVRMQLSLPWIKIATDAGGHDPGWAAALGPVHPRAYGTYPRVLGRYVREERALTVEDAVRKMSSVVADRLGLRERGLLRAGCYADVVSTFGAVLVQAPLPDLHLGRRRVGYGTGERAYCSPTGKLAIAVVVNLPRLGMRELYCRPRAVHAQGDAFHEPVLVANPDNVRQREVSAQPSAFRPRNPEHSRCSKVSFQFGEQVLHLSLGEREKVDVAEVPVERCAHFEAR